MHILNDGTYTVSYDYTPENLDIQEDSGTWTENEDGSLTLLSGSGTTYTVAAQDNGDGSVTYSMELTNAATSIVCNPTGTK